MRLDQLDIDGVSENRGKDNALTDVPGVLVGHATVHRGDLHTGVTAIVPEELIVRPGALPAALFTGNGYGKLIGSTQLSELGEIETPILLTNTLAAWRVADALASWVLSRPGFEQVRSLNPIVGETNDGYLSDIRARTFGPAEALQALESAASGPVEEGSVGAGSGTVALGYKGGIGTSSRVVGPHTVGALVQSNFGGTLTVRGVSCPADLLLAEDSPRPSGNSCMIVVATDAPLDARQLGRVAKRAVFAMARVGASFSHGSGDYGLALSTATRGTVPEDRLDPYFMATGDAVEEALLNSLLTATTTLGREGHVARAIPLDQLAARLGGQPLDGRSR